MVLELDGRSPVGSPMKTWSKVTAEEMRKLNITEHVYGRG